MNDILRLYDTARITIRHFRHRPWMAVPHLYKIFDAALEQWDHPVACCGKCDAACCKRGRVAVSPSEVIYIAKTHGDTIDKDTLKTAVETGVSRCPLLDSQNRCMIYADRPMQCRGFLVPDAMDCDESYGATSLMAAQLQELTTGFIRLNLAPALLAAMSSRTAARWLAGDTTVWDKALMEPR